MIAFALPKEILKMIEAIEGNGYQAYLVGGSVRDILMGVKPEDWDLVSNAPIEENMRIFPQAIPIGAKYGVVQVTEKGVTVDIASMREEDSYSDYRRPDRVMFTNEIVGDLSRRDFTINGIAYHPSRGLIDPFDGREDLENKIIRAIGDPEERFQEDPLRMLRGIRIAGQLDFTIDLETLSAMQRNVELLAKTSMERRRQEFEKLLTSKNAQKALKISVDIGAIPIILEIPSLSVTQKQYGDLSILLNNINRAGKRTDIRMAIFLLCLDRTQAEKAIDNMKFSNTMAKKMYASQRLIGDFELIKDKYSIKKFIYTYGEDTFLFLQELSKQLGQVYGIPNLYTQKRDIMLQEIVKDKDPIDRNDLAITGQGIMELNISQGKEVGRLLDLLMDEVHRCPELNKENRLLEIVKELRKP